MIDSPLIFARPEFVHGLWLWACALGLLVLLERRGSDALDRLVGPALQDRLVVRPSRWRRWARVALLGLSGFSMVIALMQPQWGSRFVATPRVGAEIMIALDVSRSMLADDAKPSRLERAKAEISDLLSYLDKDYVGLIAFAGEATVLSPMTPDKSFLRLALDRAGPHVVARGGTNLAEPILRAVAGMGEPGPAQRALILITDGEDHDNFAMDAARAAAEAGIKIITIGLGDEAGSTIYLRDPKTGARSLLRDGDGNPVVSRLDGALLREIALVTDGAFVPAGTGVLDLASIYQAHIAPLTRGQLDSRGRTIRDESFQLFVLLAIVCLVAAASIGSSRRKRRSQGVPLALVLPLVLTVFSVSDTSARAQAEADEVTAVESAESIESVENVDNDESAIRANDSSPAREDPRATFNRGNEKLGKGDPIAASVLLRAARRDATDDVRLRYAATYNLGIAAAARADALEAENPSEALAVLYEAADWFREAAVARPDELDPRHNLDVTLRRALILSDEISRGSRKELDAELDELIEAQRQRVAQAAVLLEVVVGSGELNGADLARPAFREAATQQRLILSDANSLGDRVAQERERLALIADEERSSEDILRAEQLGGVLVHLDSAIERMGQTRRQLRQRRAERAYRRGVHALGDLKRARDQLRDPVQQIEILLAEVGRLAGMTFALSSTGLPEDPASGSTSARLLPAFLTGESVQAESDQIETRVGELALRLGVVAANPDAASRAFEQAAPLVASAEGAMARAGSAIGDGRYDLALGSEGEAAEALSTAQELFFDLRQLLNVTHVDQRGLTVLAGVDVDDPNVARARDEIAGRLAEIQSRNRLRGTRLAGLLEQELNDRVAALEAEAGPQAAPLGEADSDPIELERQRFEVADQLLFLAAEAMGETAEALDQAAGSPVPDWPRVLEASTRAAEHLDALRTLFFSIAEHVRKLAFDQVEVRDRTKDMIALSVTDRVAEDDATLKTEVDDESEPRGPRTSARAQELADDQQRLETRTGEIADALVVQSEQAAQAMSEDAAPEAMVERDRIRKAAEHVAIAQLAMQEAGESLGAEAAPLGPVPEAQTRAIEELNAALALLSPPPPPPPEESDAEQDESQSEEGSEGDEDQRESGESGASEPEDADGESMDDPSQLLQGVRDRDAERRRDRDRKERRRRSKPVERDW